MEANIHLFINGKESNWPAIRYTAWLAGKINIPVNLVGITESFKTEADENPMEAYFGDSINLLEENHASYHLELQYGRAEKIIAAYGQTGISSIFAIGPFERPAIRRMIRGRSFRHVMAKVSQPVLYVPRDTTPIKNILICLGGLGYALPTETLGMEIARAVGAEVTFLHVVPPIDLEYPEARRIRDHWQHLMESDTLTGRILRQGMQLAEDHGIQAKMHLRNGNIVEEIQAELQENDYQLICMGSQYSAKGLRHLYTPNVTADVAENARIPILTTRYIREE